MSARTYRISVEHGPLVPVEVTAGGFQLDEAPGDPMGLGRPRSVQGRALLDTGAFCSVANQVMVEALGLPPAPALKVQGLGVAGNRYEMAAPEWVRAVWCHVVVPGGPARGIPVKAALMPLGVADVAVILGRDVLEHFVFTYDGPRRALAIQYSG